MKNFKRSLKYLWPYRRQLLLAGLCVVLIMVLWGSGLGLLLPGSKILISEEGLHGWAYSSATQDRLGVRLVQRSVPPHTTIREGGVERELSIVLDVVRVDESGPSQGKLQQNNWLVGRADGEDDGGFLRGDALARTIANHAPGEPLALRAYNPYTQKLQTVTVIPGRSGWRSRLLTRIARAIPEPASYVDRFPMLLWLLGFVVLITLLRNVLRFSQEYLVGAVVMRAMMDLRRDSYEVVLHLPTTFFSEKGISDSMSRFVQDTNQLADGQVALFGKTLAEPAKAVASLVVALSLSWPLTLLAIGAGPPAVALIRKFGEVMRKASRRALGSWSLMLAVLNETLAGIRVVKAYTMEGSERKRFFQVNRRLLKQQRRMVRTDAAVAPAVETLGMTAALGAVALAGYWVLHGGYDMDGDKFLALMGCLVAMFDPVRKLAKVATRFQRADAAAGRVFQLQDQEQEKRMPNAPMLPRHSQSIQLVHVRFRYPNASDDALKDINLTIPAGETLAIVGPNGSGKTTLASLLPRLLDPTEGKVLVDGRDISRYSLRSLRRQIGLVTQDAVLFHASIADNVAYGLRRARDEQVQAAARKAFVDEFVRDLPDGYDTMLGEHGATLSGGQRQRIAIARAILRDPAILIFDEAMSQVDPHSELRIQQAIKEFIRGRTTLLIAHRFSTVMTAQRIAVMDAGRIVDVGTHKELLSRCGLYHQLYQTQFLPEAPA